MRQQSVSLLIFPKLYPSKWLILFGLETIRSAGFLRQQIGKILSGDTTVEY